MKRFFSVVTAGLMLLACAACGRADVPSPDAVKYARIACVGDSLTYGHLWPDEAYPVYLQELLGDAEVKNFGVNGAMLTDGGDPSVGKRYASLPAYAESLAFRPEVVFIMLGSNDSRMWEGAEASFMSEYEALVTAYRENGAEHVFVMTSPPTLEGNDYISDAVLETCVYPAQKNFAQTWNVPLLDVRAAILSREGGYESLYRPGDGVHFSAEGAKFVARLVFGEIVRL